MEVIQSKVEGHEVKTPEPVEEGGKLVDLMAALEASVNAAKAARESEKPVSVAEAKKAREGRAAGGAEAGGARKPAARTAAKSAAGEASTPARARKRKPA
jgi:DNA end-binding protein Ku